jgi:hypothetical protein
MPTSKARLKAAIVAAKEALEQADADAAWDRYADKLATAIIVEIKAATITYTGGLGVPNIGVVTGGFGNTIT